MEDENHLKEMTVDDDRESSADAPKERRELEIKTIMNVRISEKV